MYKVPWDIIKPDVFTLEQFRLALDELRHLGAIVDEDSQFSSWSRMTSKTPHFKTAFRVDLIESKETAPIWFLNGANFPF